MKRKTKADPLEVGNAWFVVALEHDVEGQNIVRLRTTVETILSTSDAIEAMAALQYGADSGSPVRIHALPPARVDEVKR